MRFHRYFCTNKKINELMKSFPVSQGPLYHYTDTNASIGIQDGNIWLTRADDLDDVLEIEHGINIFSIASKKILNEAEQKSFSHILNTLRDRLKQCYVMSLSSDSNNAYLKREYSRGGGVVIELHEAFPGLLYHEGRHSQSKIKELHRIEYAFWHYNFFEGIVIYEHLEQLAFAAKACKAYSSLLSTNTSILKDIDQTHLVNFLIKCLVLFKNMKYKDENEYRVGFIKQNLSFQSFELERLCRNKIVRYICLHIPKNKSDSICTMITPTD